MPETIPFFPVQDYGPLMKGLVIGGLGILHVVLAQFAIGGGLLLLRFEHLAGRPDGAVFRRFQDGYFQVLVLVSFVLGALTGVAMWFTAIQVGPEAIGFLVTEFHWLWAVEWTFFCLEIVAGYAFYRYGGTMARRDRRRLLLLYALASWASLFWINGILSFQLTPGAWLETGSLWDGFLNPGFLPSLLYRTVACLALAGLVAAVVANLLPGLEGRDRRRLVREAAWFLVGIVAMPLFGAWYLAAMPPDSRQWVLGGSPAMSLFLALAVGASLLLGAYAVFGLLLQRLHMNGATATLLLALAAGATAGGEFVREGARKPYTIRQVLYSNGVRPEEVADLRAEGVLARDPWPLPARVAAGLPTGQLRQGERVFRRLCATCHTMNGVNGLAHLTAGWSPRQLRLNLAQIQRLKPFMPPFAGSPRELEALVQRLLWEQAGRPPRWPEREDPGNLARIRAWMEETGE